MCVILPCCKSDANEMKVIQVNASQKTLDKLRGKSTCKSKFMGYIFIMDLVSLAHMLIAVVIYNLARWDSSCLFSLDPDVAFYLFYFHDSSSLTILTYLSRSSLEPDPGCAV